MRALPATTGIALSLCSAMAVAGPSDGAGVDDDDNVVLPDLQVKGSTGGESKVALALAFWFPRPTPDNPAPHWRPSSWTLAIDATSETRDGLGRLLLGRSGDTPTFKAPVTWSAGLSVGLVGSHSAEDLFGPAGAHRPQGSTFAAMDRAIRVCEATCSGTAAGCDRFKQFTEAVQEGRAEQWARTTLGAAEQDFEALAARVQALLPAQGEKCLAARAELDRPAHDYVDAAEALKGATFARLVSVLVETTKRCHDECGDSKSDPCDRVRTTAAGLRSAQQIVAETAFPEPDNDLCDAGKAVYKGDSRSTEAARYQRYKVALGGSLGFTPHDYLAPRMGEDGQVLSVDDRDASGVPTGAKLPQLEEKSKTYGHGKLGVSGAYLPLSGMTLEGRATYERNADAQSTKAQWCAASGVVGETSTSPKATSCQTLPVGLPDRAHKMRIDAYVGYADLRKGLYRVAIGPQYTFSRPVAGDNAVSTHALGVLVPFSLNLLAASRNEQKLDYDGLVRLTPYYEARFVSDKAVVHTVGVSLELLGKRSLFSTRYDEL